MKPFKNQITLAITLLVLTTGFAFSQQTAPDLSDNQVKKNEIMNTDSKLKTFVIEREIPDAGKLTAEQLKAISITSCSVIKELGPDIRWLHSYVTGNKIYCVYEAIDEDILATHAKKGGFPANSITQVSTIISPATAE
ncbi:MAG TPA: DUF4242 domain-containing protein [Cytophagales bacterium]|nr:DUF4242 domain-containing protein [Cytophagales bacterium]